MENEKELNGSALNEVTGGSDPGWVTYQEYCMECGYVVFEAVQPKDDSIRPRYLLRGCVCPQCQKAVEVNFRIV